MSSSDKESFYGCCPNQRMDSDSDDEDGVSDTEEPAEEFEEVTEKDERVMSMFMASDAALQRTLADISGSTIRVDMPCLLPKWKEYEEKMREKGEKSVTYPLLGDGQQQKKNVPNI